MGRQFIRAALTGEIRQGLEEAAQGGEETKPERSTTLAEPCRG